MALKFCFNKDILMAWEGEIWSRNLHWRYISCLYFILYYSISQATKHIATILLIIKTIEKSFKSNWKDSREKYVNFSTKLKRSHLFLDNKCSATISSVLFNMSLSTEVCIAMVSKSLGANHWCLNVDVLVRQSMLETMG